MSEETKPKQAATQQPADTPADPAPAKPSGNGNAKVRNILLAIFVIIAFMWVGRQLKQRKLIEAENAATEMYNSAMYDEALVAYQGLYEELTGEPRKRVGSMIAKCYLAMADDPKLAVADQLQYYRKADEYDSEAITDPRIRTMLERENAEPEEMTPDAKVEEDEAPEAETETE